MIPKKSLLRIYATGERSNCINLWKTKQGKKLARVVYQLFVSLSPPTTLLFCLKSSQQRRISIAELDGRTSVAPKRNWGKSPYT